MSTTVNNSPFDHLHALLNHVRDSGTGNETESVSAIVDFVGKMITQDGAAKSRILEEADKLMGQVFGQGFLEIREGVKDGLMALKEAHINGSKHSLSARLKANLESTQNALNALQEHAQTAQASPKDPEHTGATIKEAQEYFISGLAIIDRQVAQYEAIDKKAYELSLQDNLAKQTATRFGKTLSQELISGLEDDIAPSKIFHAAQQSKYQLPQIDLENETNKDIKEMVEDYKHGNFTTLTKEQKNQVLVTAEKFFNGDISASIAYKKLNQNQVAYLEYLRQASQEISGSANIIEKVLNGLGENLPAMLVPVVLGGALGSVFGGMGMAGAIVAVLINLLGSSSKADENSATTDAPQAIKIQTFNIEKQKPPVFQKKSEPASEAQAA